MSDISSTNQEKTLSKQGEKYETVQKSCNIASGNRFYVTLRS